MPQQQGADMRPVRIPPVHRRVSSDGRLMKDAVLAGVIAVLSDRDRY